MKQNITAQNIFFGYKCGEESFEIYTEQALIVEVIFRFYADGKSLLEIADILHKTKVFSPRNRPTWGKQTLSNILSNPVYLGTEEYPAIISEELFNKVQEIKAKNTRCRKK